MEINEIIRKKGPFIDKYDAASKLEEQFKAKFKDEETFLQLIKINSNELTLLGTIVASYEDHIYILRDIGEKIEEDKIYYKDIDAVTVSNELLLGKLLIIAGANEFKVIFDHNSMSDLLVGNLVSYIRELYKDKDIAELEHSEKIPLHIEQGYASLLRKIDFEPVDYIYQPKVDLQDKSNRMEACLLSSLYIVGQKELVVIDKGKEIKTAGEFDYGYGITYIPRNKIVNITKATNAVFSNVIEITINLLSKQIRYLLDIDNPKADTLMKLK